MAAGGKRDLLYLAAVAAAVWYAFVSPCAGLQAMGSPTMFAGLLQFGGGGGNHLLLPVGALASAVSNALPFLSDPGLTQMVRVDYVSAPPNGSVIRAMLPEDLAPLLPPAAVDFLNAAGGARYYGVYVTRMAALGPLPPLPPAAVAEPCDLSPYTAVAMPAFELRRVLAMARARAEPFTLRYTPLPPTLTSPAEWAAYAEGGGEVTLEEVPAKGVRLCSAAGAACSDDEVALQPPPPRWVAAWLLPYPTPLHVDQGDDIYCLT